MKAERPINLDLTKFHFPPMAIVSIAHRISGVILFLFIPLMLYLLSRAIISPTTFTNLQLSLANRVWMKFWVWVMLSAAIVHLFAGIRHLIMDLGVGESVPVARRTAYTVFILSAIAIILAGVWLW